MNILEPNSPPQTSLPELAAPVRDWEALRAAVENGADAVYFGLQQFNARMRARNFTVEELPKLMRYLHSRGVRGYACINTLIFTDELLEAEHLARACINCGVDGIVVQDIGLAILIRKISPDVPIHASTQMTITHSDGIKFASELGCNLVVLARECSIAHIQEIQKTLKTEGISMPLQVFVHGALCVSFSGQCLTSASFGGRSANRGECAQACRLPYQLVVDGKAWDCDGARFLLSTRDLNTVLLLPELIAAGAASLKIEGRMKHAGYVAIVADVYRKALDRLSTNPNLTGETLFTDSEWRDLNYKLEMGFSRGFCPGWLLGPNYESLVHGLFPGKRGPLIGKIVAVTKRSLIIDQLTPYPIAAGDGIVVSNLNSEGPEPGGRVHTVIKRDGTLELTFPQDSIILKKSRLGMLVYKTSDPQLDREIRRTYTSEKPVRRSPLDIYVIGQAAQPLKVIARDHLGYKVEVTSKIPLQVAHKHPLTESFLAEHLGRLGDTPFYLRNLSSSLNDKLILPVSELNRLRREMVEALIEKRVTATNWTISEPEPIASKELERLRTKTNGLTQENETQVQLWVMVRSLVQLEAALEANARCVYLDLPTINEVSEALRMFKSVSSITTTQNQLAACFVAPPRITLPGEERFIDSLLELNPDGVLIRNAAQLYRVKNSRFVIDATFNVANPIAFNWLLERFHPERITPGYDLTHKQVLDLTPFVPTDRIELIIHQHIPMFHMQYCLFARWIARAPNRLSCGAKCKIHSLAIRDRKGVTHPVLPDPLCRNTVFNGQPQSAAEYYLDFLSTGITKFRVEFVNESPEEIKRTLNLYQRLLAKEIDGATVCSSLKAGSRLGVLSTAEDTPIT